MVYVMLVYTLSKCTNNMKITKSCSSVLKVLLLSEFCFLVCSNMRAGVYKVLCMTWARHY